MSDAPRDRLQGVAADTWRTPALNSALWTFAILGLIWIAVVLLGFPETAATVELWIAVAGTMLAWSSALWRRGPESWRIAALFAYLLSLLAIALEAAAPRPMAVVTTLVIALLASVFVGWRGRVACLGIVVSLYAVACWGWTHGVFPSFPTFIAIDYTDGRAWRTSVTAVTIGSATVSIIAAILLRYARRALREAREAGETFSKSFRASPDAMFITRLPEGHTIEINHGFERLFGVTRDEAVGKSPAELGLWLDMQERAEFLRRIEHYGGVRGYRCRGKARDGSTKVVELSAETIELRGDRCLVGIAKDLTDAIRQEEVRQELERQVRESQKLESLGTLAGGIAHDFNNLLTAIINFADLARLQADDPAEVKSHIAEVTAASMRARDLVRQILTFSRRQGGTRQPTRCQDVVREALKLLRSALPSTIQIHAEMDECCPAILADSSQIHQIVMNLGTNAGHAMRERPGTLTVRVQSGPIDAAVLAGHPELKPVNYVRLVVADTGTGMSEVTRSRIFEPFFTTKRPEEGTGLGLAVVHGIVRAHDGAITVESVEGSGTTFTVLFPALAELEPAAPAPRAGGTQGRGERILIVDDEPAVGASLAAVVRHLGYRVDAMTDSSAALELVRGEPDAFDLILTDLTMPKLTGIELAGAVHALRPALPIILMTGYTAAWTRGRVRAIGLTDMLVKPLGRDELDEALRKALDAHARTTGRTLAPA